MAHHNLPVRIAQWPAAVRGAQTVQRPAAVHVSWTARCQQDMRMPGHVPGYVHDRVMSKSGPTAPEVPFANGRVWLLRLTDGYKAWEGWSNAQGWYRAEGLEAGVEYIAVGIDPERHYKATGAGPVRAKASVEGTRGTGGTP